MGIQSGLCNGINGNTEAGGAQLCSLAQQRWRASLGAGVCVCIYMCAVFFGACFSSLEASIVRVCERARLTDLMKVYARVCQCMYTHAGWRHSSWLELGPQSAKWHTHRHTNTSIFHQWERAEAAVAQDTRGGVWTAASVCLTLGTVPQHHSHVPPGRFSSYTAPFPLFTCPPLSNNSR